MDANRIYEQNTGHAKSIKLKTLNEIAKSVCKIYVSNKHCTGFFLKIQNDQKTLYILITSYQLIPLKLDKIRAIKLLDLNDNEIYRTDYNYVQNLKEEFIPMKFLNFLWKKKESI